MKKVFITKEQFNKILAESVKVEGTTIKQNSTMKAAKDKTYKYLQGLAKQNDPNFQKTASNLGLNTDKFGEGEKKYNTNYDKNFGATVDSGFDYQLNIQGTHNIENALLVIEVGLALGINFSGLLGADITTAGNNATGAISFMIGEMKISSNQTNISIQCE